MNLIKTPKKVHDTSINSHEREESECFDDKSFEIAKLKRLKTIILKTITKDIEDLIRNELLRNKYILSDKSSD